MDVRSYVSSTRFAVTAAAIAVAIPANYLLFDLTESTALAFLGMFTLGVSVPQAYSRSWPRSYDALGGVAWAVGACAATLGALLGLYAALSLGLDDVWSAVGAFLGVQLALSAVGRSLEAREEDEDDGDAATGDADVTAGDADATE